MDYSEAEIMIVKVREDLNKILSFYSMFSRINDDREFREQFDQRAEVHGLNIIHRGFLELVIFGLCRLYDDGRGVNSFYYLFNYIKTSDNKNILVSKAEEWRPEKINGEENKITVQKKLKEIIKTYILYIEEGTREEMDLKALRQFRHKNLAHNSKEKPEMGLGYEYITSILETSKSLVEGMSLCISGESCSPSDSLEQYNSSFEPFWDSVSLGMIQKDKK